MKAHKHEVFSVIKSALTTYYGNDVFAAIGPRTLSVRVYDEHDIPTTVEITLTGRRHG